MIIDMSPMSTFLTIALYVVGIPAIILSVIVLIKIGRSFYVKRDYEDEIPSQATMRESEQTPAQQPAAQVEHVEKEAAQTTHQTHPSRDTLQRRVIQSG